MTKTFRAFRIHDRSGNARLEEVTLEELSPGDVVIRATYSGINYKDALAATGKGQIIRRFPLIGGIDVAGTVVSSTDERFREGDGVLVTGHGLSEQHNGGYAEFVRVPGDWVVPLPAKMTAYEAMALGTAGFTAAFAIMQMEHNGLAPEQGEILVNGATGGVGGVALDLLSGLGYKTVAVTGKADAAEFLMSLGAGRVLLRQELEMGSRPLEKSSWAGAIDNLGGDMLAWLTRTVMPLGNIASVGLAAGDELQTTVMPFILRGVNLLGINSALCERDLRFRIWARLASDMRPRHLDRLVAKVVGLHEMGPVFDALIGGGFTGRAVVRLAGEDRR